MAGHRYKFNSDDFTFKKVTTSAWGVVWKILKFFIATSSLAVVYYMVFSLFVSTDTEKKLREENLLFEQTYEKLKERDKMLSSVITGLEARDNEIYCKVFKTAAPSLEQLSGTKLISISDTLEETDIALHVAARLNALEKAAAGVDDNFLSIFEKLSQKGVALPPMTLPVESFSYARCGASVGNKINPFYKVEVFHSGLDIISSAGEKVLAAADGTVSLVRRSSKGDGNVVEIGHEGGFVTKYAHLADISVRQGSKIRKGDMVGTVGTSGSSFAPHLHYEVWRDSVCLDPVNHFFASLGPNDYAAVALMAASAGQSMD